MMLPSLCAPNSRVYPAFFVLLLSVLALCLAATPAQAAALPSAQDEEFRQLVERDAFSQASDPNGDTIRVTNLNPPSAANRVTYRVGGGDITTFVGKTPSNVRVARKAYVILHGVKRDGAVYWDILNSAYASARSAGITSDASSIRIAPNFLSTRNDAAVRTGSLMGWADQDAWAGGDGPTAPAGTSGNLAAVLDTYLDALADRGTYPNLDTVVFVGHGAGAQGIQRYAALGKDSPRSGLRVRYVVANPSTNLYFTRDRSVPVNVQTCARYNDFRYGLDAYQSPYPKSLINSSLFKRYMTRDVRYLVGDADTNTSNGDQSCAAQATGGGRRRDRNYDYWAYLHLLAGRSNVPAYPGLFPALDPGSTKARRAGTYTTTTAATLSKFRTNTFNHQLTVVPGVAHNAARMFGSSQGLRAVFGN